MIYEYGANGYPDKILFPGGYYFYVSADDMMMRDYYVQDYQGNNRMVVHQYMGSDFVGQTTHYYPFGGVIGDISTNQYLQDYKYSGKEFDRTYGLDFYDFHARQYDPKVPAFTSIDPKAEDYYGISPYAYCAGDPVNCVDPKGEDVCVLNAPFGAGGFGHLAILVQNEDDTWSLYSKNGTTSSCGSIGPNDKDMGDNNKKWFSPEDFLSDFDFNKDEKGNVEYTNGYIIQCEKLDDDAVRTEVSKECDEYYSVVGNNCAVAVQEGLNAISSKDVNAGSGSSIVPNTIYKKIKNNNEGIEVIVLKPIEIKKER